ncbi:hydantoinase B/oxoprolinase family protein [Nocardiopsis changdeensis]|uniref:Hydantoinase B/oxoprolinase family protein n=1 Tax=Nocardiopsis changdeensis TaxID=2831969 RepID=A0ABX8BID1_9ACTN|nr:MULTISPECIES: hydantoinase B/oxoprolinase family protein [Nocardiopsis]QUX20706.1 hydantoinase B/oxoprolinase family protein [Nocardiopsis changdeensis]QYX36638.1 hydantoinase B/oxoprolinase family protein [Nocardiopsis sp. MT53]
MSANAAPLDGATVEVIRNYVHSVAEQMRRTLVRSAFNPVIYDVLDFGISIYDSTCRLMAEAAGITHFLGANDHALLKLVEYVGEGAMRPGDVYLMNYPYWSGAHSYDAMLCAPVFRDGHEGPAAYLAVRAHWMDLGAKEAGYVLDSTDMHQEGLIFPGTRIVADGEVVRDILELIRFNSRLPEATIGDFHAQLAALRTGEERLRQVWEKFGGDTVEQAVHQVIEHGERVARRAVAALPDGTWSAVDYVDDDYVTDDPIRIAVEVTIAGDEMTVDFNGSSGAVAGPVNLPIGSTLGLAKAAFKGLTTRDEATNAGHFRPLKVVADPGTFFHAVYPAATFTQWSAIVAFELIYKALAGVIDSLPASSGGDEPGFMALGNDPRTGRDYVVSNNEGIGWGAARDHDGGTAQQHPSQTTVRNTPVEVLEHKAALFHEKVELIPDSGGPGRHRGGLGVERVVRYTAPGEVLSMKKKSKTRPWAMHGGHEPEPSHMDLWPGTDREKRVGMYRAPMAAGDRFANRTAGGGGYGDPLERDPEAVVADVLDGYVTARAAREHYGVEVAADGTWSPTPERTAHTGADPGA